MNTKDFQWEMRPETYQFFVGAWDVAKAKEIIQKKPRKIVQVNLKNLQHYVQRKDADRSAHRIDWTKVDSNLDLDFPLIAITVQNAGPWIIDGWHRMAKGFEQQRLVYNVAILTERESEKIRFR